MAKARNNIPSVLAFEKKLVPSDGFFYGTTWENRLDAASSRPLSLVEKAVRGTISNRLSAKDADPAKLNAKMEVPNLQRVDSCALGMEQDTLRLSFTLKVLSGIEQPSACNLPEFQESYEKTTKAYMEQYGFHEIARRYAINLANGRYLWRNRLSAEEIEVHVTDDVHTWIFSAYDFPWKDFEEDDLTDEEKQGVKELAAEIADALCGKKSSAFFHIDAYARVGEGQEVYPSQELVLDTNSRKNEKGKKSKILYQVDGIAAMHSQKIGNALRTIDTWYPAYEKKLGPIAVEPYGAVTSRSQAFRTSKEKADFYTLFDSYALGNQLSTEEDEHYVMAMLVRGGVFGQGSKENE